MDEVYRIDLGPEHLHRAVDSLQAAVAEAQSVETFPELAGSVMVAELNRLCRDISESDYAALILVASVAVSQMIGLVGKTAYEVSGISVADPEDLETLRRVTHDGLFQVLRDAIT